MPLIFFPIAAGQGCSLHHPTTRINVETERVHRNETRFLKTLVKIMALSQGESSSHEALWCYCVEAVIISYILSDLISLAFSGTQKKEKKKASYVFLMSYYEYDFCHHVLQLYAAKAPLASLP